MEPTQSPKRIDSAELTEFLADLSEIEPGELEIQAEEFFVQGPENAEWEYSD